MKKILVCLDGSEMGPVLVREALKIAAPRKSHLALLYVSPNFPIPWGGKSIPETHETINQQIFSPVIRAVEKEGVSYQTVIREGHPAMEIIAEAEEKKVSVIVIGHRGISHVERFLLGSVATQVVSHAPCSVLVVREGTTPLL